MTQKNEKYDRWGSDPSSDLYVEKETLRRIRHRDPVFLNDIFYKVNPFLKRICAVHAIYNENAEDLIHKTWETFLSNLEKFEGRSQIRTFICGILINKIREYRRAQKKIQYQWDLECVMNNELTPEGWWRAAPISPYRTVELRQAVELINNGLERLTNRQKAAYILKEIENEDSEKICRALGVNVSHLRVLLFRAKEKLRAGLENAGIAISA